MKRHQNTSSKSFQTTLKNLRATLLRFWQTCRRQIHTFKLTFLASFTKWIDPKLEKYRAPDSRHHQPSPSTTNTDSSEQPHPSIKPTPSPNTTIDPSIRPYTPTTTADFLALLKRTPRSVLDRRERHVIATIMNFPTTTVAELMLPPSSITYVHDDEVLGPLTLDRLYRSGYQHFPVLNGSDRIIGIIHTTALNSLEIKKSSQAKDILDPKVYYLRADYTLYQALAAFLRTNCYFFLVIDHSANIVGMLTYQMLIDHLLGETPNDQFDRDSDKHAVAHRK